MGRFMGGGVLGFGRVAMGGGVVMRHGDTAVTDFFSYSDKSWYDAARASRRLILPKKSS
jgi:hypothetical protein